VVALVGWLLLFAALTALEGLGLTIRGWPTVSSVVRAGMRPPVGRWLLLAAWVSAGWHLTIRPRQADSRLRILAIAFWLWIGWHFFIRGWPFFLRGPGARVPHRVGRVTWGHTIEQVVLPLAVFYAGIAIILVADYRRPPRASARPRDLSWSFTAGRVACDLAMGYVAFVVMIGAWSLLVGEGADGIVGSAAVYGAFLAFVIALPCYTFAAWARSTPRFRRRPPALTPNATPPRD
jgi:hypothetical protein